ncbi:MAG: extensin family protein [Pseudomonadota bacterium]
MRVLLVLLALAGPAVADVPVPAARPALDPIAELIAQPTAKPAAPQRVVRRASAPAAGRGCEGRLARAGVTFTRLPAISEGACGAKRPLKVTSIKGVALSPAATLRCGVASATADWVADVLKPAARRHMRSAPKTLHVAASYHCRVRRNGRRGNRRLSEHGFANAIDIRAFTFANGKTVSVQFAGSGRPRGQDRFQKAVRAGACGPFKTVLGPGSDSAHGDHLHFDLAQRRRGGTYCR